MSRTVYVPYVVVEISEEDHWEEVDSFYFNSYIEAMTSALALVDYLRKFHTYQNARCTPSVYIFTSAK